MVKLNLKCIFFKKICLSYEFHKNYIYARLDSFHLNDLLSTVVTDYVQDIATIIAKDAHKIFEFKSSLAFLVKTNQSSLFSPICQEIICIHKLYAQMTIPANSLMHDTYLNAFVRYQIARTRSLT